jgi:hypothetical protein
VALAAAALAVTPATAGTRWLVLGVDAGATSFDAHLADYQWDVAPRSAWGAEALAGAGPLGLGARLSSHATTQRLAIDGVPDPKVSATRLEVVAHARLTRVLGIDVAALGSAGRQRLAYHPSRLEIPAGGTPVTVELRPVDGWIAGGGMALSHALPGPWNATFALERSWFALDTAHTSGGVIVEDRETFGLWDARLGVNWLVTSR